MEEDQDIKKRRAKITLDIEADIYGEGGFHLDAEVYVKTLSDYLNKASSDKRNLEAIKAKIEFYEVFNIEF